MDKNNLSFQISGQNKRSREESTHQPEEKNQKLNGDEIITEKVSEE